MAFRVKLVPIMSPFFNFRLFSRELNGIYATIYFVYIPYNLLLRLNFLFPSTVFALFQFLYITEGINMKNILKLRD